MRLLAMGERALTVEFAPGFDDAARRSVARLDAAIARARAAGRLPAVIDTAPAFRSLTVHYDPLVTPHARLAPAIAALADAPGEAAPPAGAHWRLPVAYGGAGGPDLEALAEACCIAPGRVIDLHAGTPVDVYMLGFLPGFAFMGDIAEAIRRPRRAAPRTRVPAGSVAVADRLTAVYPWESPGGWHLIGRCPVALFDAGRAQPALLSPGDRVAFEPASPDRIADLAAALAAGEIAPDSFAEGA